jgi:hypothetical protein
MAAVLCKQNIGLQNLFLPFSIFIYHIHCMFLQSPFKTLLREHISYIIDRPIHPWMGDNQMNRSHLFFVVVTNLLWSLWILCSIWITSTFGTSLLWPITRTLWKRSPKNIPPVNWAANVWGLAEDMYRGKSEPSNKTTWLKASPLIGNLWP